MSIAARSPYMSPTEVLFEPSLVEEVVRRAVDSRPGHDSLARRHRAMLDDTYALDGPARLAAAQRANLGVFIELGWRDFFVSALGALLPRVSAAGVSRADRNEGCYIDGKRRLQVRLRPSRFEGDRAVLARYLRHECEHVFDILDPAFGYRDEVIDEPTRERYAKLWCAAIEARLRGEAAEPMTHAALLQRARAMLRPKCSLCDLPAAEWVEPAGRAVDRIRKEYPQWTPGQRVCERCVEWAEVTAGIL
jgi:hypothetical protein